MFQFIISILTVIVNCTINSKLKLIRKMGYFIYEIKTDLLVSMYRRNVKVWEDADFSYVEGASLYYTTFEDMYKYVKECMEADATRSTAV
jgi:hypothetical protein